MSAITLAEPRERRLLDNIEQATRQRIAIEPVPSVAELRAKQAELTAATVRQALEADDLDDYGELLGSLADDGDLRTVALAAIKLVHEASGATADEPEIPTTADRPAKAREASPGRGHGGIDAAVSSAAWRRRRPGSCRSASGGKAGVRPADLVGAIANEAGLTGADIGPIRINENSSIVGVPVSSVERSWRRCRTPSSVARPWGHDASSSGPRATVHGTAVAARLTVRHAAVAS